MVSGRVEGGLLDQHIDFPSTDLSNLFSDVLPSNQISFSFHFSYPFHTSGQESCRLRLTGSDSKSVISPFTTFTLGPSRGWRSGDVDGLRTTAMMKLCGSWESCFTHSSCLWDVRI